MAIGKFDLSKIRAERVTQSHADNDMEFIDKMNSAKQNFIDQNLNLSLNF